MTQTQAELAVQPAMAKLRAMAPDELAAWLREGTSGMFTRTEDRERALQQAARSDINTVAQILGEGMTKDLRENLGKIKATVTTVVTTESSPVPADLRARRLARIDPISAADLVFMIGRHVIMYDRPTEFSSLVDRVVTRATTTH